MILFSIDVVMAPFGLAWEDEWRPLQGVHGCVQAPSSRPRVGGIVQLRGRHRHIFYLFMGTSHIGSCVWYYLVRTEDPTIELACHWCRVRRYFTVVSLVSCSSPMLPHSATEMTLAPFIHVFGGVFGSLLISRLAAWLVDTKALQCISPALLKSLAFAVHRKAHVRPLAVDLAA